MHFRNILRHGSGIQSGATFFLQRRFLLAPAVTSSLPELIDKVRDILRDKVGSSKIWGEKRDATVFSLSLPDNQTGLAGRRMTDSYREVSIPLGSEPVYKTQFVNQQNTVRIGKILEALDTLAVWIGYTHTEDPSQPKSPLSIVTACVDSISLPAGKIVHDADILLRGHVTYAGQTSLKVTMHVDQAQKPAGGEVGGPPVYQTVLQATFLMVARDPQNKRKAFVNPLIVETDEERRYFDIGETNKKRMIQESKESLLHVPPTAEEQAIVHSFFQQTLDQKHMSFKRPIKPEGSVWMDDTKLKNIFLCFPEQRNLYNKIFGGFLMRVAFELGFINALVHCKSKRVHVTAMDDIMFRSPVEIGSLLYLSSQVVYTEGSQAQVKVHAETVNPQTGEHKSTNEFHFTFTVDDGSTVPRVIPRSYAEYMMYLEGRRHFLAHK